MHLEPSAPRKFVVAPWREAYISAAAALAAHYGLNKMIGRTFILAVAFAAANVLTPVALAATPAPAKPATASAASNVGIGTGDMEVSVFGLYVSPDDADAISIIGAAGGYYFTDNVVGKVSLYIAESGGVRVGELGLGGDYLFNTFKPQGINTPLVPYVGGAYLIGIGEGENLPEIHGGLKQFIGERVSINYELQRWFGDLKSTNLLAQLSFYF